MARVAEPKEVMEEESPPEGPEVWSPTQFYSVDFSQSRIVVKSAFSTNAQSRFASVHKGLRYKGWDVISRSHQRVVFTPTYFRRKLVW